MPIPTKFLLSRYFSRCGFSGRLGTPALDGVLAGVLAGVLDGAASSFYVFLLFIYPPNMVFIRNFPVFSRNITGKGLPKESVLFLRTFEGKDENIWGKGWERLRESWQTFEGKEFHFILPAEIVAYGTRAVSWPMFSPLSVTKWPSYHTIPSKFASNREILFCANEPKKREKASEWGEKTWNLRPLSIEIWYILCPFQALEPCSHVSDNIVTHCKSA